MNKNQKIIAAVIIIIIFLLLLLTVSMNREVQKSSTLKKTVNVTSTPTPLPTLPPAQSIMITYTRAVPNALKIKKGMEINFANFSGAKVEIVAVDEASADLNVGVIEDNDTSKMILLKKPGTYKYQNKLDPKISGEITVQ